MYFVGVVLWHFSPGQLDVIVFITPVAPPSSAVHKDSRLAIDDVTAHGGIPKGVTMRGYGTSTACCVRSRAREFRT